MALAASASPPLVFTDSVQGQIGDWTNAVGGNDKLALLSGRVTAGPEILKATTPRDQPVVWTSGLRRTTPVISPAAAAEKLVRLGANGGCSGCDPVTPLLLTDPQLIRRSVSTATGPAAVPVWSFGVGGSKVRVTVLAIPQESMAGHPAGFPGDQYWSSTTAHRAPDGSLTVTFIGPEAGTGPCAENYTARLVESVRAVAVLIDKVPKPPLPAGAEGTTCTLVGYLRTAQVKPAHPLAGRVVIDGASGMVLPLK